MLIFLPHLTPLFEVAGVPLLPIYPDKLPGGAILFFAINPPNNPSSRDLN